MSNKRELLSPLIQSQFPEFFSEDGSNLPSFLEKYYVFLESIALHFTNLELNEYAIVDEDDSEDKFLLESDDVNSTDVIILESDRDVDNAAFEIGEIITGDTSKATGEVTGVQEAGQTAGGYTSTSPHHVFVKQLTGTFLSGEKLTGSGNRTTATLDMIHDQGSYNISRRLEDVSDIDNTPNDFLEDFRKEFIPNIPKTSESDLRLLTKIAKQIYENRGNELSFEWLWKALYAQQTLEFSYPKDFIFKVSDSNWVQQDILLVNNSDATNPTLFAGRKITGLTSNASATVQSLVTETRGVYNYTKLVVTDVIGTFQNGEYAESTEIDGKKATGQLLSQVSDISIINSGTGYDVGDTITISGGGGIGASASVNTVTTGAVSELIISDGGDGYTGSEQLVYTAQGISGNGASGQVTSIENVGTARILSDIAIEDFSLDQINAADYGDDLSGHNMNTHLNSNAINTFDMTVADTSNFAAGMFVTDTANDVIATIIAVPDSTSIIYAIKDEFQPNFLPGDNPSNIIAYHANSTVVSGASTTVNEVSAITDSTYFGAFDVTETTFGSIKTVEVLTSGSGFDVPPTITVSQPTITAFENNNEILGQRTRFLNFSENVQFIFNHGFQIQGISSGAAGTIVDPFIESTANSTFSTLRYRKDPTLLVIDSTNGSADAGDNILLEDGYDPTHVRYDGSSSLYGQFKLEELDFFAGETVKQISTLVVKILLDGTDSSGTDAGDNILTENDEEIIGEEGSAFESAATAVTASTNTVSVDNQTRGNNAVITSGDLSIGAITSVSITDFGIGFTSTPSATSNAGDNNATFTVSINTLASTSGEYTNEDSLLSGKDKIQDSFYYQDYSYVLKTDISINEFRDPVKSFIHPAGWNLFGEISIVKDLALELDTDDDENDTHVLFIELAAQSVSGMAANMEINEYHITFLESAASITFTPVVAPEYIVLFPRPQANNYVNAVANTTHYEKTIEPIIDDMRMTTGNLLYETEGQIIMEDQPVGIYGKSLDLEYDNLNQGVVRENRYEVSQLLDVNNTDPNRFNVRTWEYAEGTAFANTNSTTIRTVPTLQDFFDTFSVETTESDITIQTIYNQEIATISDSRYAPTVANNETIYLPDIYLVQEDFYMLIDSTDGSADAGDELLLEDGFAPTDGSYSGTSSTLGRLIKESDSILFEDSTHNIGDKVFIHQKTEAFYQVSSVNSTAFTVANTLFDMIPAKLHDFNTEHYNLEENTR